MYRLITIACSMILTAPSYSFAHMADSGMIYDEFCCDSRDCKSLSKWNSRGKIKYELEETDEGYVVTLNERQFGDIVPYDSKHIHESGDQEVHLCLLHGDDMEGGEQVRCIYIPKGLS